MSVWQWIVSTAPLAQMVMPHLPATASKAGKASSVRISSITAVRLNLARTAAAVTLCSLVSSAGKVYSQA